MKMNCHAQTSLAVEDTLTGARSALAAGLRTCLINPAGSLHLEQTLSVRDLHAVAELVQRAAS
jgi:beta-phosphoglucomutase-like phosphatase (HAD superfamily)